VRKGDDAKAHKELNQLGGNMREEKEMDTGKAQNALSQLTSAAEAEKAAKLERERELSKVKIDRKDVELIMAGPALSNDENRRNISDVPPRPSPPPGEGSRFRIEGSRLRNQGLGLRVEG